MYLGLKKLAPNIPELLSYFSLQFRRNTPLQTSNSYKKRRNTRPLRPLKPNRPPRLLRPNRPPKPNRPPRTSPRQSLRLS